MVVKEFIDGYLVNGEIEELKRATERKYQIPFLAISPLSLKKIREEILSNIPN